MEHLSTEGKLLYDLAMLHKRGDKCKFCIHGEICKTFEKKTGQIAEDYMVNCYAYREDYIRLSDLFNHLDAIVESCETALNHQYAGVSEALTAWAAKDMKLRLGKKYREKKKEFDKETGGQIARATDETEG